MCSDPSIPETSETHCKTCIVGQYTKEPASRDSCKSCSVGYFMPATDKQKEPYFTICIDCRTASVEGASTCAGCDQGKADLAADGNCVSCEAGTFAGAGSLVCTDCRSGYYSDATEDYQCKGCAVGYYSTVLAADNAGMLCFEKKTKIKLKILDVNYYCLVIYLLFLS